MSGPWFQAASKPPPSTTEAATVEALSYDVVQQRAIVQLAVALEAIPQREKLEYLHALRVAPQLVEKESNPLAYLRFCHWNVASAMRMMTVYWRKRKELFGEARAFLPLLDDLSGNGALGCEELEILQSGGYCLMPNDTEGRAIFVNDRHRIPSKFQTCGRKDVRMRACFMVFQQMSMNPMSQTSGGGGVFVMRGMRTSNTDNIAPDATELMREAFPIKIHAVHIAYIGRERRGFFTAVIPFLVRHFGRFLSDKLIVHDCELAEELVEKFAKHGITRESLPRSLGGVADYNWNAPSMGKTSPGVGVEYREQSLAELKPLYPTTTNSDDSDPLDGLVEIDLHFFDCDSIGSHAEGDADDLGPEDGFWDPTTIPPGSVMQQVPTTDPLEPADFEDGTSMRMGSGDAFAPGILDMVLMNPEGSSPFEPMPIRSAPQQQQCVQTQDPTRVARADAINDKDLLGTDIAVFNDTPATTFAYPQASSSFDTSSIRIPQEQHQGATAPDPTIAAASLDEAPPLHNGIPVVETPVMHERGLVALNEALGALPRDKQAAYSEAARVAPAVVQRESDPLAYLRFEKFNTWAAAQRLALYWTQRVAYFGERAFLPMTQTMGGALWLEDLRTLAAGSFFFLPADSRGRPVLCYDPSKHLEDTSSESRIRVALYFFSILACENPVAMTEGCVLLVFVSSRIVDGSKFDDDTRRATDIALDSFPIKTFETHVICTPSPTASPLRSFAGVVLPYLQHAIGRLLSGGQVHYHVDATPDDLKSNLLLCGMSGAGLQAAVSGGIGDLEFAQWMKRRQRLESERCSPDRQNQQQDPPLQTSDKGIDWVTVSSEEDLPEESIGGSSRTESQDIIAAMQLVPASEKQAYLEAMEKVPKLVQTESDPVRFLKVENSDTLAAAKRLASYWRIRHDIFGERAFLPMNQTADGALSRKDVTALQKGFLVQLPNDAEGRSVICCDGSRLVRVSPSSRLRVFFYMWTVLSQNNLSQTEGYSVLYNMVSPRSDRACKDALAFATEAHPASLMRFHVLGCLPDGTSESYFRQDQVYDLMKLLGGPIEEKAIVHICESRTGFASKLSGHGMSLDGLPNAFGGKWGLEKFVRWQELRVRHEWDLSIAVSWRELADSYSIPESTDVNLLRLTDEERAERQRRLDVIHSRRKRERARIEVQVIQEQCSSLREEQKALLREGRELEELLRRAQAIPKE